jgi:type I restriction enzyme, S subunit
MSGKSIPEVLPMSLIRLLNNGAWSKPPVLTAARRILMDGLSKHWPNRALGDLATFVNGTSYDRGALTSEGTPIIRISNISDPHSARLFTDERFDDRFLVQPGDLLVSWSASFKSIIWPGPAGILNQHIFRVSEKPGNHRGFIRHAIEAALDDMQRKVVGIGMMHLRRGDFLGHEVPSPDFETQRAASHFLDWLEAADGTPEPPLPIPLAEQRRIVARIEDLAGKIEEARGLRRQTVEEAQALLASTITALELAEGCWSTVGSAVLGRRGSVRSGPFGSQLHHNEFVQAGIAAIGTRDVQVNRFALTSGWYVTPQKFAALQRYQVFPGDVLATIVGASIGRFCVVPGDVPTAFTTKHVLALTLDRDIAEPPFVSYMLNYHPRCRRSIFSQSEGSAQPSLNAGKVLATILPLPSLAEQRRIVAYLDDLQARIATLKQLQAETAAELNALLPAVLDKAFKGEL